MLTEDMVKEAKNFAHMLAKEDSAPQPLGQPVQSSGITVNEQGIDEAFALLEEEGLFDKVNKMLASQQPVASSLGVNDPGVTDGDLEQARHELDEDYPEDGTEAEQDAYNAKVRALARRVSKRR